MKTLERTLKSPEFLLYGDHFLIHASIKSLCRTPETGNTLHQLHFNFKKLTSNFQFLKNSIHSTRKLMPMLNHHLVIFKVSK